MLSIRRHLTSMVLGSCLATVAAGHGPAAPATSERPEAPPRLRLFAASEGDELTLRADALADLAASRRPVVLEDVPLAADRVEDLLVQRFFVTGDDTLFVSGRPGGADRAMQFDPDRMILLRGQVVGREHSHVYLVVDDASAMGAVDLGPGAGRFVLGARGSGGQGMAFSPARGGFAAPLPEICGLVEPDGSSTPAGGVAGIAGPIQTRSIDLAVDTDFEYFELFGDADAAMAYVVALYGAITDIYLRDVDARFRLSFVRIWEEPEGLYDASNPLVPFREHWNEEMSDVERDVAQLLTGRRNLPYGGVAYLSQVCSEETSAGYSVAGYILGSFVDATGPSAGNWDIVVSAHELGHNCGSTHTHSYDIDACDSGAVQRGSIMSYCHTTSGGTANIDLRLNAGVPSQPPSESNPQEAITSYLSGRPCLVSDCNGNGIDDLIDVVSFGGEDSNGNGVPDECEDCNDNGVLDDLDLLSGTSADVNSNGLPDDCEPDCNDNGLPDDMDLSAGTSEDLYGDGVPDECDEDCDGSGVSDYNEIQQDMSLDIDRNAVLDACQDCDGDGTGDFEVIGGSLNLWVGSSAGSSAHEFHALTGVLVSDSESLEIGDQQDVLAGPDGLLYVSSASANLVARLDPSSGQSLGAVADEDDGVLNPAGLAFRPNGNLLVANRGTNAVLEFGSGDFAGLGSFVAPGAGGLADPFGLAFGPNGNLFVSTGNNRVLEFDGDTGVFVADFVTDGDGGLSDPHGLLFKPDGNLLVASHGSDAVLEFDGVTGGFIERFDRGGLDSGFWALHEPWTLRLSAQADRVFVSSHVGNAAVHSYDLETGLFLRSFYVLAQNIADPTGFDLSPASSQDCNLNLVPDPCDIASGTSSDENGDGVPDECAARVTLAGDVDGSGVVDVDDLVRVILAWGPCPGCDEDVDGDGSVDVDDLVDVILAWGECS